MTNLSRDQLDQLIEAKAASDSQWAQAYATLQAAKSLNRIADQLDMLGLNLAGACNHAPGGLEGIAMAIAGRLPAERC